MKTSSNRSHDLRRPAVSAVRLLLIGMLLAGLWSVAGAQGVGISESSITPNASAILELRSTTRGFLMPRNSATLGFSVQGLSFYNTTSNRLNYHNGSTWLEIPAKTDNLSVFASTTSAQLSGLLSDETGSGLAVFATSPMLTTPDIGVATATSVNKVAITAPLTSATLTLADGSTLATSGAFSTTLTASGATNVTLPTSGTLYGTATGSISSADLLGSLSDETGSGAAVFATSPNLTTPNIDAATGTSLSVTGALTAQSISNQLVLGSGTTTTISATAPAANRVYTLPDFGANGVIPIGTSGNTISLTTTGTTSVTLPVSGTLATTGVLVSITTLTTGSSSPYTPNTVTKMMIVYIIGGGGQGGGSTASNGSAGAGGGAGGVVIDTIEHFPGVTYTFSVGAAGSGAAAGAVGNNGGNSTFNGITANGGVGGTNGSATIGIVRAGGTGGIASGGAVNIQGMNGYPSVKIANTSYYGIAGTGGSTIFGSGGAGRTGSTGAGNAGTGYGAGGGGGLGATAFAGGAGTEGAIIVYEFK